MPFPNLVKRNDGSFWAEATGTPDNGDNTFDLSIDPAVVNEDWLQIDVISLGSSVTGATYIGINAEKTQITINFSQSGTDQATVIAQLIHSEMR